VSETLKLYYDALSRLQNGNSTVLAKGTRISNDSVSIEAGRKKGSIKNSRPGFSDLIAAIKKAKQLQGEAFTGQDNTGSESQVHMDEATIQLRKEAKTSQYREMYEALLSERAGVLLEVFKQRDEIKTLRATLATQTIQLKDLRSLAHSLEAELTRLRASGLKSVPHVRQTLIDEGAENDTL
jgi:hypothetical protein